MERREAPFVDRTLGGARFSITRRTCAPRRSIAVSCRRTGRASGGWSIVRWVALTISELLAAGLIAGGRNPVAARAPEVRFPRPAGTASLLHHV